MKKTLWLIFLSLGVFLLSACGSHSENPDASDGTGSFHSVTQEVFPEVPPTMTVVCGDASITAWRGTYSWETHNLLGIGQAVCADSMHPLDAARDFPEEFPVLNAEDGDSLQVHFDVPPDSMSVRYYPDGWDSYDPSSICYSSQIDVRTGLYEIIAEWNKPTENYSGEVHYAFRVE